MPRRAALILCTALLMPAARSAVRAAPLDEPHVGALGFSGPTTGDLGAVYWNPAALALISTSQIAVGTTARLETTTVARSAIDPASGLPGGARRFPAARGRTFLHPAAGFPGSGAFLGAAAAFSSRFTFAVAAYTPFVERVSFDADGEAPTRYQMLNAELRSFAVVPALAFRFGRSFRVGVAPGFLFSTGRLTFDQDRALEAGSALECGGAPCGVENRAAALRYELGAGREPFDARLSFTLAAGVHLQRPGWQLGLAYISRPLGGSVDLGARGAHVRHVESGASVCADRADAVAVPEPCVFGRLRYELPDVANGGLTLHLGRRWDLTAIVRWLNLSRHRALALRFVWPADETRKPAGASERVELFRGLRDAWDVRLRATYRLTDLVQIAGTLRGETAAAAASTTSAGNVGGAKVEPALAARVRLGGAWTLHVGYALSLMRPVEARASRFDPSAAAACRTAGEDLEAPACRARAQGTARPTAAGRYEFTGHTWSASLAARL